MKHGSHQYGELAPRNTPVAPWQTVAVDCIGPWVIELHGGKEIKVIALITINIATNLLESTTSRPKHLSNVHIDSKMCTTLVLFVCTTLVVFVCTTLVLFMCITLVLFVCTTVQ